MANKIITADEARQKLLQGVELQYEVVGSTLGPRGSNVVIGYQGSMEPRVIHDGVTAAKAVVPKDDFERAGAQLIRSAAEKTNAQAGDGTSLTTILAYAIAKEAHKSIQAGNNAMMIRRGIEKAVETLVYEIYDKSTKLKSKTQKIDVATIVAGDRAMGEMIIKAFDKVGNDGVITVERGNTSEIEIEYKEGMQFDQGWISPYFITNPRTQEAVIEKPVILITNKTIGNINEFLPLMQMLLDQNQQRDIVIIAKDVIGEVLASLVMNKLKGQISVVCVRVPGSPAMQDSYLEDIALVTGGAFINETFNRGLNELQMDDLGRADRVIVGQDSSVIVGGAGNKNKLKEHIKFIRGQLERDDLSEYNVERLRERLAKLVAGVAVIKVGANSDAEIDEKRERIVDAVSATKAAIEEGVVPGGERALPVYCGILNQIETSGPEEAIGVDIVRRAVNYPYLKLLENAGLSEAEDRKSTRLNSTH